VFPLCQKTGVIQIDTETQNFPKKLFPIATFGFINPLGFVEVLEYGTARVRPGMGLDKHGEILGLPPGRVWMVPTANGYSMVQPQDPETGWWFGT
jgi:hypothetical protein